MQFFNTIFPIDRVRNNPKLLAKADAVILGAYPDRARVLTTTKREDDENAISGIFIAEVPSWGNANNMRRKKDRPIYNDDSKELFAYAGNLYVYDVNGIMIRAVDIEIEDPRFDKAMRHLGIDPKKAVQAFGI